MDEEEDDDDNWISRNGNWHGSCLKIRTCDINAWEKDRRLIVIC